MPTRAMLYVITPVPNNPHISAGGRLPGHNLADSMIHPAASALPGIARVSASQTKMSVSKGNGQPTCRSNKASFRRPMPISMPAAPMASRQMTAQRTSSVSCRVSTPCTICTATPTTVHDVVMLGLVFPADSVTMRGEEPSRISTCRPVRAVMAAAVACNNTRLC